jgi:signal transduction histidine kinase
MLRALKQERELEAARNLFLNNVTHELKTPIAGLQLNLETLLKRELKVEMRKELLQQGLSETRRLSDKVNHLLMGTFADSISAPDTVTSNLKTTVESVLLRKEKEIMHSAEKVDVKLSDNLIVRIPPAWLESIVSNPIQNALLYCEKPIIQIYEKLDENEVRLYIKDNGPGIPEKQLDNIFLPLVRLDHNRGFLAGSGMGLYISRKLAESSGGKLIAMNDSSGGKSNGAIFELRLVRVNHEHTSG